MYSFEQSLIKTNAMNKKFLFFVFHFLYIFPLTAQNQEIDYLLANLKARLADKILATTFPLSCKKLLFLSDSLIFFQDENRLWGFMNEKGKIITPAIYSLASHGESPLPAEDYRSWVVHNIYFQNDPNISKKGDWLPYYKRKKEYNSGDGWGFGGAWAGEMDMNVIKERFSTLGYIQASKSGIYGIMNRNGEEICPFVFQNIQQYALPDTVFRVKLGEKYGLMDSNFSFILPPEFDYLVLWRENFKQIKLEEEDFFGSSPTENDENLDSIPFFPPLILAANAQDSLPKINHKSKFGEYDWRFSEEESFFSTNWSYDLYDKKGQKITSKSYEMISSPKLVAHGEYHAKVQIGNLFGILNQDGKEILPVEYDCIVALDTKSRTLPYYKVCKNGLWGIVNIKGEIEVPIEYEAIGNFHEVGEKENALVLKKGKYGVINAQGKFFIPCQYNYLTRFDDTHFLFLENKIYHSVNLQGEKELVSEPKKLNFN
jgi:hypothetical protein